MSQRITFLILLAGTLFGCRSTSSGVSIEGGITASEFKQLLQTVAEGWNEGDARKAADCFSADAIYTEPPDKQVYVGREALYRFFGGDSGRPDAMTMVWRHLVFDEESQVGAGEYSFTYGSTVHGVAMIKIREGLIANWREYQYGSDLSWDEFTGKNKF